MAKIELEQKYLEISKMPQWDTLKKIMKEEGYELWNIDKLDSYEELCGAKIFKKWLDNLIRKIDGAKDALDFKGKNNE